MARGCLPLEVEWKAIDNDLGTSVEEENIVEEEMIRGVRKGMKRYSDGSVKVDSDTRFGGPSDVRCNSNKCYDAKGS